MSDDILTWEVGSPCHLLSRPVPYAVVVSLGGQFSGPVSVKRPDHAKDPANNALKKEMEELKKYMRFIEWDNERRARHEAHRLSLKALENDSEGET